MVTQEVSGLAVMDRLVSDGTPLAPVDAATHAELVTVEHGGCAARMPTLRGDGLLESLLVLTDFALGLSYFSTLAATDHVATIRLGVALLARPSSGQDLLATARVDQTSAGVGLSSATITDREGRPVARCVGRHAALRADAVDVHPRRAPSRTNRPTPWRLLMPHRGEPSAHGRTSLLARPDSTSLNSAGSVQGGALAGLAARGLSYAFDMLPEDFAVSFVRPVTRVDEPLLCRIAVDHDGRRHRVGRAELVDERDRLCCTATASTFR